MYTQVREQIISKMELQIITNMFKSKKSDGGPIDSEKKKWFLLNNNAYKDHVRIHYCSDAVFISTAYFYRHGPMKDW